MNLLEFNSKLSSHSQERVKQFSVNSLLFNLINGMNIREEDLIQIDNTNNTVIIQFISEQEAMAIKERIIAKIVPGVYGAPLYGIMADQIYNLLKINFVEL